MIRTVPITGSTNADMLEAARHGAAEGEWLRAERQSGGRGRQGRAWQSPPGNLYASTIVRPLAGDPPHETLALVAAVALDEVAAAYVGEARLRLKWPNDLLAEGGKLAGILLEREGAAIVIGFGVNLAIAPVLPDRPSADLAGLGAACDPDMFLDDLASAFARWLRRWRAEGFAPVRSRWLARAHPEGTALAAAGRSGLFAGLERDGALRLLVDGQVEVVRAGEVLLL